MYSATETYGMIYVACMVGWLQSTGQIYVSIYIVYWFLNFNIGWWSDGMQLCFKCTSEIVIEGCVSSFNQRN